MSEQLAQLEKKGGALDIRPVLIGSYAFATTSEVTRTLSQNLDGFKYLWFCMESIPSDTVWTCSTPNSGGYAFSDVEYFKSHPLTMQFAAASSGSATFQTIDVTYVNGTTFKSKSSSAGSRNLYVYGIKA